VVAIRTKKLCLTQTITKADPIITQHIPGTSAENERQHWLLSRTTSGPENVPHGHGEWLVSESSGMAQDSWAGTAQSV